ncbi:iron complex outermembrane receptor protein [Novosphingobium hassiacum]|uniref:Iron complex outermembrane receptor protein n=1 Tax=Novosphingobium hassiacum TaxID=173676 RepID=A0A7W6EWE3_9SPHN|nr:TonB-dependent receptor [Novosphingobium hassiacum]MBB3860900.1 iron complex outermembrane receptor protein [Novosphingobium hassiacum]
MSMRLACLMSTAAAVAVAVTNPARAQDLVLPSSGAAQNQNESSAAQIEDIVVTARRTEEPLQKVPAAVTAIATEQIRKLNIVDPRDLTGRVPSLTVGNPTSTRSAASFTIRGLSGAVGGGDPAVTVYVAEVPTITAVGGSFYDLQNVQVLKGPQGTLFGRNSTGGAVLLEPKRPVYEFGGYAEATVGDFGLRRFQGALNAPLVDDKLLVRAAFDIFDRDGYTREVTNGVNLDDRRYKAARLGIAARPSADFENYLLVDYSKSDTNGAGMILTSVNSAAPLSFLAPFLALQQARGIRKTAHSVTDFYDVTETHGVTNISTYRFSEKYLVKLVLGYRAYRHRNTNDIDSSPLPLLAYVPETGWTGGTSGPPSQKQFSGELQLQGKSFDDKLDWITGLYADDVKPWTNTFDAILQFNPSLRPSITVSQRTFKSKAAFASATYDLGNLLTGVSITGGVRYTDDKRTLKNLSYLSPTVVPTPDSGVCPTPPPAGGRTCIPFASSFSATTWNAGINWQANDDTLLYVASRRGYKGGGFNVNARAGSPETEFQPEFVTDIELGAKTQIEVGANKLRLNAALYRTKYDDIQFTNVFRDPVDNQIRTLVLNGPQATLKGAEIEATFATRFGLTLGGFYSHFDGVYDKLTRVVNSVPTDFSGTKFGGARDRFGVTATYDREIAGLGDLELFGDYNWTGAQRNPNPFATVVDPTADQKAYGILNLRASLDNVMGSPIQLFAFVTNVTDKVFYSYYAPTYESIGVGAALFSEPRMFGLGMRVRFGADAQ